MTTDTNAVTLHLPPDRFGDGFHYQVNQNHSVFLYHEESEEMYVGGAGFVLKLDVENYHVIEVGAFQMIYL